MADAQSPRKLPFWLIVSILVNMLLIGLIAGVFLKRDARHMDDHPMGMGPEPAMEGLANTADRRQVHRLMRAAMQNASDEAIARHEARRRLAATLSADPYDAAAVREAFSDLRMADNALMQKLHANLEGELATLNARQRLAIARAIGRGGPPAPRRVEGGRKGRR